MQDLKDIFISLFSILTILSQVGIVGLGALFIYSKISPNNHLVKKITGVISDNFVVLAFLVCAGATAGSFVMSDILGFLPCKLCWYQRVFMFPQVVISGIALIKNDTNTKKYLVSLSVVGAFIAIYHLALQALPSVIQCGDELVSCEDNPFTSFGYITIPVMSLTAFLTVIFLSIFKKRS